MNAVKTAETIEISQAKTDAEYVCPHCGKTEHTPNTVTLAAMREAEAIAKGEIPSAVFIAPRQYKTREELKTALKEALPDWIMLIPEFTRQFVKDFSLMQRRRKNIDKILDVMTMIIWEESLPAKYREHNLSGNYAGYTECHVEGDLLLIYKLPEGKVIFTRAGTHSDLF